MNEASERIRKNELKRKSAAIWRANNLERARELDRLKARYRRKKYAKAVRESDRQRYLANREQIRERRAAQYAENVGEVREKALAYQRRRYSSGSMRYRLMMALNAARGRAKTRKLGFDLTLEDIGLPARCAVSGIEFDMSRSFRQGNIFVPSLDRIDPALGYTKGNVRVVCHGYNLAKHTGTDSDVLKLARAIVAMADKE